MSIMDILGRVPSPIVFDHLAHVPEPAGINDPLFARVRALIDKGKTWVKLSGAYQDTKIGPPTYADSSAVARAYVQAAPERMVWGSDWPHPSERQVNPHDALLFDFPRPCELVLRPCTRFELAGWTPVFRQKMRPRKEK